MVLSSNPVWYCVGRAHCRKSAPYPRLSGRADIAQELELQGHVTVGNLYPALTH